MNTITSQGIQEDRSCTYESLTLTGSHLRYLALVQNGTSEELYVVVYHVPYNFVTAGLPVVQEDSLVAFDTDKNRVWLPGRGRNR